MINFYKTLLARLLIDKMDDKIINRNTIRKRKSRENETSDHRETRIAKQREKTQQKRAVEIAEERDTCRTYDRERKRQKLANETDQQREKRLEFRKKLRSYVTEPQPQPQQGQATNIMPQQDRVELQQDRTMELQKDMEL